MLKYTLASTLSIFHVAAAIARTLAFAETPDSSPVNWKTGFKATVYTEAIRTRDAKPISTTSTSRQRTSERNLSDFPFRPVGIQLSSEREFSNLLDVLRRAEPFLQARWDITEFGANFNLSRTTRRITRTSSWRWQRSETRGLSARQINFLRTLVKEANQTSTSTSQTPTISMPVKLPEDQQAVLLPGQIQDNLTQQLEGVINEAEAALRLPGGPTSSADAAGSAAGAAAATAAPLADVATATKAGGDSDDASLEAPRRGSRSGKRASPERQTDDIKHSKIAADGKLAAELLGHHDEEEKKDDDMTDDDLTVEKRMEHLEHYADYERRRRKELQQELAIQGQAIEEYQGNLRAVNHTVARIAEAMTKDEALWQHLVVMVKKKTMRMREFYERSHSLQIHLKSKPEIWPGVITMSSAGPATTVIAKTKDLAQAVMDTMKTWSNTEGIAREVAIFKGKENMRCFRERPLTATRNALSEQFGIAAEAGKRLACQPHWPEHFSPDWALSCSGSILAWSETQSDGFTMHVYINDEHPAVAGQKERMKQTLLHADAESNESLYYCIFAPGKITPLSVVQGRGTDFQNGSKGRGKGKGKSGRGGVRS